MGKLVPASGPCHPPANTTCGKSGWDFTRFNTTFWQHYDQRVAEVAALGIVPEIILFHPYDDDHWGFDRINRRCGSPGSTSAVHCTGPGEDKDCLWCDELYIKYMVSRVSAYGTWWSMANEWDLEKSKTVADWDQLFQTLQQADATHDRERSIHNCKTYACPVHTARGSYSMRIDLLACPLLGLQACNITTIRSLGSAMSRCKATTFSNWTWLRRYGLNLLRSQSYGMR